jgi:DNA-binding transcriptional ArsR family regulator
LNDDRSDVIESLLSALMHPLRRGVLRSLIEAGTPMSPKELAASHGVPVRDMSHHVRRLVAVEGVKLVARRPATNGTTEHFYEPGPACRRPLVRDAIGLEGGEVFT